MSDREAMLESVSPVLSSLPRRDFANLPLTARRRTNDYL